MKKIIIITSVCLGFVFLSYRSSAQLASDAVVAKPGKQQNEEAKKNAQRVSQQTAELIASEAKRASKPTTKIVQPVMQTEDKTASDKRDAKTLDIRGMPHPSQEQKSNVETPVSEQQKSQAPAKTKTD